MSLISVVIPVIGGNQYSEYCLRSVFNSTYRKLEVILISNNIEEVKNATEDEFGDKVIYIDTEETSVVKAWNIGIRSCRGDLIALMDMKDITGKMRLELEVNKLNQNKDIGMVFCGMTFIDGMGNFLKGVYLFPGFEKSKFLGLMYEKNRIGSVSTTLIKSEVIRNIGLFDEELIYESEYDFWLRIARKYQVECLDLPLLRFRINVRDYLDYFNLKIGEKEEEKILLKHDTGEIAQSLAKVYDNEEGFRVSLGSILYRMGKKDEALKNFQKALSINSKNSQAYFLIGNYYFGAGNYEEARNWYEESLTLNPNHAECRNNLGVLLFKEGKKKWSIEEFKKAKKLKEDYLDPLFNLECMNDKKSFGSMRITDI